MVKVLQGKEVFEEGKASASLPKQQGNHICGCATHWNTDLNEELHNVTVPLLTVQVLDKQIHCKERVGADSMPK